MLLVDDYGYEVIQATKVTVDGVDGEDGVEYTPETWWSDIIVSYWLMFGAIIILNLFIGKLWKV